MLSNYITDAELKKYHPNLSKQLWLNTSTYINQISESFQIVVTDMVNKGFNPRLIMIPFDLKKPTSSASNAFPYSSTETASTTGSSHELDLNLKRFVTNVSAISGIWKVKLQGSNDNSTWEDITELTFTSLGIQSVVYDGTYKYWRYISTEESAGSITYQVFLEDTAFDKLIIYKTFHMIFSDFRKVPQDSWDMLVMNYQAQYDNLLTALKFMYDSNDDGTIEKEESVQQQIQFLI